MLDHKQVPKDWRYAPAKGCYERPINSTRYITIEPLLAAQFFIAIYDYTHCLKIEKIRVNGFLATIKKANKILKKYELFYRKETTK